MDCTIILFFLLVLTATQTTSLHHHCNSDVHSSASGMADVQQLTILQYCLIDNCTIVRIDTGQQLDIVYTTESHLVVTPTDGQTSIFISKNDPEVFCSTPIATNNSTTTQVIGLIVATLIALVSGYIAVIHMIFKELCNTFGKLMMLYYLAKIGQCFNVLTLSVTHHNIALHLMMPCYLFNFLFMQSVVVGETFATTFLAYLAYSMYYSYRCREVTKEMNKKLYKRAVTYVLGLLLLFDIFVIGYDFGTGTYKHTLLPNGHCSFFVQTEYDTTRLLDAYGYFNEITQISLLAAYFVYYYKLKKMFKIVRHMPNTDTQQNRLLLKIAIMMGANLGISQISLASSWYFDSEMFLNLAGFFFLIQQIVIMFLFMCSKKMLQLWKAKIGYCTENH